MIVSTILLTDEAASGSIMINSFQLCRKTEIVQEAIEMQMQISAICAPSEEDSEGSESDDEDLGNFMNRCQSLSYNVEIGELHERDKFNWVVNKTGKAGGSGLTDKKMKQIDFRFQMNHIKQVVSSPILTQSDQSRNHWHLQGQEKPEAA
jgi:hypothetical protein